MIHNLQLLRAFAAISVVFLHATSDAGLNINFGVGGYGVDLFFVISGFTIAYIGRMPAFTFFLRRCIRIVPLYWALTLATFSIAWAAPGLVQTASANVPLLLRSLLFAPYPNELGEMQPTLPLGWTLNYEMYFYTLFAIGLLIAQPKAALISSLLLLIVAVTIQVFGVKDKALVFYADPIIYEFLFGVIVYFAVTAVSGPQQQTNSVAGRCTLFVCACVALAILVCQEKLRPGSRVLFAGLPSAFLVFSLIVMERKHKISVSTRWVLLLGDASYVLYLIHPFVVYGAIRLCMRPSQMGMIALILAAFGLTLLACITAIVIHIYLEAPVLNYLRRRLTPQRTAPVAVPT